MKKIYLVALLSTVLFDNLEAQVFGWAKREGYYAYDYGYGITTDNAGNVYCAGKYEQTANFSGTTLPCVGTPDCNHDIWIAQYSAGGTLNWIRTGGGSLGDYSHTIACDGTNYVYTAGEIEGTNALITFPGSSITLTCTAGNDIFLAKYDLSGNLIWARSAGGPGNDKALGITFDNAGNVFICGLFSNSATFGGSTTITEAGGQDAFIAKYDANGNFLWVQQGGSPVRDEAKGIKCDAAGNIYMCGMYGEGAVFSGQTLSTYNHTAYSDAFLAKYTTNGALSWIKTSGGDFDDVAWSMTMDNAGKIYTTGEFNAYAMFGSTPLTSLGWADVFVACYDASGNTIWAKGAGGTLVDRARGIGCNGTDIFITGQFAINASFGSNTVSAADSSDIFFASLDNSGNFIKALSVGGTADAYENLGYESGIAICGEPGGNVYATGALLDGGVFGSTTLSAYGRTDVFITAISQLTDINSYAVNNKLMSIYPNPGNGNVTVDLNKYANQRSETIVYNSLGGIVSKRTDAAISKLNIDLSNQESGVYYVEIKIADLETLRHRLIIQR